MRGCQGKWEALRRDLATLLDSLNTSDEGDLSYEGEYLVVTGRKGD